MKDPARGAATSLYAATAPELADHGGGYFSNCRPAREGPLAGSQELAELLWERSEDLTAANAELY
jgi:WW domain-containing oxidoreductase